MNTISAKNKGLITGTSILLLSAITFYIKHSFDNYILLVAYGVYATGIVWTLLSFHDPKNENQSFKDYFQQGFKCFIIVTLMMVCATWLFMKFNVSLQDEMVAFQRHEMQLANNYSEPDIEEKLKQYRKILLPGYTIGAILSYLGIGTLITCLLSVFLNGVKRAK